ncbi:hypothetical protein [Parachitinimonas caeni]|uniref:Uncharacterized protein n=1 Tax=Parachitinimonas caeni TaxID=3031301 RepID=A0ABT7E2Q9_9NEIS|nr:hypothetical protein [Parachitinimonas caeni]MDK2126601.1 hypothetical protein [Parachitinimonas caeni]
MRSLYLLALSTSLTVQAAETFTFDANHIKLLQQSAVGWGFVESGAPLVILPGSFESNADIEESGCKPEAVVAALNLGKVSDSTATAKAQRYCAEMGKALDIALRFGEIAPGTYPLNWPLRDHKYGEQLAAVGLTKTMRKPTFTLQADHIKLLRGAVVWRDTTAIDGKRPYGDMTYYFYDMSELLGRQNTPKGKDGYSKDIEAKLEQLHFETQPALQVFLREARFKPGRYTRQGSSYGWVQAQ